MQLMFGLLLIALVPIALFFGIIGLAIFIWCWNRIGRYFINFSRWLGSWRNFIPLSLLGIIFLILTLVILPIIGLPKALVSILLILLLLATVVIMFFALITWTIRFCQWFWPPYRKFVWSTVSSMWGSLPRGSGKSRTRTPKPSEGPTPDRQPTARRQQPQKRSVLGSFWALMLGKPSEPARPIQPLSAVTEPSTRPPKSSAPVKRSWFASFWALMLGKPEKAVKSKAASVKVQTTDQSLGRSQGTAATARTEPDVAVAPPSAVTRADRRPPRKRSWFGAFWALMLGRPSKSGKPRPGSAKAKTSEQVADTSDTAAATAKTGATARVGKPAATPERLKKEKPAKRGFVASVWTSIIRGVTFAVGLVFLGVMWVVQKIRVGIEWIRIRLNLD